MKSEDYINDNDLGRFNTFLQGNTLSKTFYYTDDLPSIETMFDGDIYHAILHKKNPNSVVGHWVVLIRWDHKTFEYFDCLGHPPPQEVIAVIDNYSEYHSTPIELIESRRRLMATNNYICGKWVMFRLFTLPNTLEQFYAFFDKQKRMKMQPDALVNFVVNIPADKKFP